MNTPAATRSGQLAPSMIELAQRFGNMEKEHSLFRLRTLDGTAYWDVFRKRVWICILASKGIYDNYPLDPPARRPRIKKLLKSLALLPGILINEFRLRRQGKKSPKFVFLLNSRFSDSAGRPVDLLFEDIFDQLKSEAFPIELFRQKFGRPLLKNHGRYFLYELEFRYLFEKWESHDWSPLDRVLNNTFSLSQDWYPLFSTLLARFRTEYAFFHRVLKILGPKFLFFQSEPKGMIAAANELGIQTADLQHGHFSDISQFYNYPDGVNVGDHSTIASALLTLGKKWNTLPFPNAKITIGNSYFDTSFDSESSQKKGIMFVSSLYVHNFLQREAIQFAEANPGLTVVYKMHSNQIHQVKNCRQECRRLANLEVICMEKTVKEIMDRCFAIALIQSSVTYQALQQGLKVFIFKKSYYEDSYEIFEEPSVFLIESASEITNIMMSASFRDIGNCSRYFEPYRPEALTNFISDRT